MTRRRWLAGGLSHRGRVGHPDLSLPRVSGRPSLPRHGLHIIFASWSPKRQTMDINCSPGVRNFLFHSRPSLAWKCSAELLLLGPQHAIRRMLAASLVCALPIGEVYQPSLSMSGAELSLLGPRHAKRWTPPATLVCTLIYWARSTIPALACPAQNSRFLDPITPTDEPLLQPGCAHFFFFDVEHAFLGMASGSTRRQTMTVCCN